MSFTYAICTIQRTGSNMLCDILTRANNLGKPTESFGFWRLNDFDLTQPIDKIISSILEEGKSQNGVLGVKIMYNHLPILANQINEVQNTDYNPQQILDLCKIDKHIYLYRKNKLRQAISFYKADKTKLWKVFPGKHIDSQMPEITFSRREILRKLDSIIQRENEWERYFKEKNITPLVITYEDLTENRQETLLKVFNYLGESVLPEDFQFPETNLLKQADEQSEEFYRRFNATLPMPQKMFYGGHKFLRKYWTKWGVGIKLWKIRTSVKTNIRKSVTAILPTTLDGYHRYFWDYYEHREKLLEGASTIDYHGKKLEYSYQGFVKHKCIFFHIPKTAGISVSLALFGNLSGGHENAQYYKCLFRESFNTYYKFAFVRNPYTRLVSAYEYIKSGKSAFEGDHRFKKDVLDTYETFDDFVHFWLKRNFHKSRPHFRTQFSYINLKGKIILDFIAKYENLEADFEVIRKHLNIETTLPKENITFYDKSDYYKNYYSNPKTVATVQEIYKDDFKFLGYSTDITKIS